MRDVKAINAGCESLDLRNFLSCLCEASLLQFHLLQSSQMYTWLSAQIQNAEKSNFEFSPKGTNGDFSSTNQQ